MQSRREFLVAGLLAGAAVALGPALSMADAGPAFSAGAGRADVVFDASLFPLDGFAGERDPLAVRVLLLDGGAARLAIAVVDLTSISDAVIARFKAILGEVAGVEAGNAIVCASHTFSAPHVFAPGQAPGGSDTASNDAALQAFDAAVHTAATQAASVLQPATLGFGQGISRVNVNRDVETPSGWWLGANDAGYSDPTLGVLRIDRLDGRPLAILMNFAVQSSIMDGSERAEGGRLITADLAGAAARHVEAHFGADTVALFLVGAAGDQAPYLQASRHVVAEDGSVGRSDIHEAGFTLVDLLGERLGGEAVRVAGGIEAGPVPALEIRRESIEVAAQVFSPRNAPKGPVTSFDYEPGGTVEVPIVLMRLGDVVLVGVQPELSASIGARIRESSPFALTLVATMVDGAAKYMPDAQGYDRFTYEARSAPFAKGAAEAAASGIIEHINRMKEAGN
ncbi:hypothetical protein NOF55_22325 [Rhizobiaceae bacterium BDR2-2]|uniref:Neutral/alkaline non-lysosomal ceramidase, N-terminal n=1 Tax=Ectorhizobium quercum TaxID=2965071 RepID=A0AAE3N3D0_9HYPH|nr:hypothetical protein [Ectorhizobium quercum]MCX8999844.1 hypothetical protein [Ectorhizobium quercum]